MRPVNNRTARNDGDINQTILNTNYDQNALSIFKKKIIIK